jgi:glycosyltransferase 2 family protein
VLGPVVSIVALAGVVWWAARQPAPTLPSSAGELAALGGAVALYALAVGLRGERWFHLLAEAGRPAPRADAYGLMVIGYMGNAVIPARGGDALRIAMMAPRAQAGLREVIGTAVAERVLDVLSMVLFLAVTVWPVGGLDAIDPRRAAFIGGALGVVLALGALLVIVARRTTWAARLSEFLAPMAAATRRLGGTRHGVELFALSVASWAVEAGVWWMTSKAVGFSLSLPQCFFLLPLANLAIFIPAGPGYAGTLDAAVLLGLRAIGESTRHAVSFLILLRAVIVVPAVAAGAVLLATRYGGIGQLRSRRRGATR